MNTKEILKALLDGKKLRSINWTEQYFIQLIEGNIVNYKNELVSLEITDASDFEIYDDIKYMESKLPLICTVWDVDGVKTYELITRIDKTERYKFISNYEGSQWEFAEPLMINDINLIENKR